MASTLSDVLVQPGSASPYQLNIDQTLKASTALLQHVRQEAKRLREFSSKKSLLDADDGSADSEGTLADDTPIWLTLTTKQHIVDKNRLKPSKLAVPHSLNTSSSLSICLITADPQRAVKDVVADPSFPTSLSSRITKVIGYTKLKARYQTFESRRQLLSEHDIFLADDRIVTRLVDTLGKVFYKGTSKRPIPMRIAQQERNDGKRIKNEKKKVAREEKIAAVASPSIVAREIESTLSAVPVSLKQGTNVAVRVGMASFTPLQLSENIQIVARGIIEKHVVKGWRNVKSIHVKSPNSVAIPIWLADDMWTEDGDVIDEAVGEAEQQITENPKPGRMKRKATSDQVSRDGKKRRNKSDVNVNDQERVLAAARKAKLLQQKSDAMQDNALESAIRVIF